MVRDPLVSVEALRAELAQGAVKLVDATWFLPGSGRDARAEHQAAHLPGAVFFDIDAVADPASALPHMLASPQAFAVAVGALGLSDRDRLVVYDRAPVPSAPRVWWSFRVMGQTDVRVLDGGLDAWRAGGGPLEGGDVAAASTDYVARFRPALVRDFDAARDALAQGAAQLVDARPAGRFRGEAAEPRPGLRSGHAPGALNLPASALYDASGRFLAGGALAAAFAAAGVDPARPVIASCGSGVTAGTIALGVARLGGGEAAVYDGSWAEWGGRADAPVATGP